MRQEIGTNGGATRQESGFTLLEMLVVIGIMGLIAGLMFPAVQRGIDHADFRATAASVEAAVRAARAQAMASDSTTGVTIPVGGNSLARPSADGFRVPRTMRLDLPRNGLRFFSDGSATGGEVRLTAAHYVFRLTVNPDTGIITVSK